MAAILGPKYDRTTRSSLKNVLAAVLCAGLLAFSGAGMCQTPGYGDKPDQWAPYESGQYFDQLQNISKIHRFDGSKISYLHFELRDVGIGPVELFRIPVGRSQDCIENDCYFFAVVASDHSGTPV